MKKLITKALCILTCILFTNYVAGQSKGLANVLESDKKFFKAVVIQGKGGCNQVKKWQIKKGHATEDDFQLPKKVGILTYILSDTEEGLGDGYVIKATKSGATTVAQLLYDNTISDMKKSFSEMGMQLLEPSEYLDTPEKQKRYDEIELKDQKMLKTLSNALGAGNSGVPDGYRNLPPSGFGFMPKAVNELHDFYEALELDAILVVEMGINYGANALYNVSCNLAYKNPAYFDKSPYNRYQFGFSSKLSANQWEKNPPYGGIIIQERVEEPNKKGKVKKVWRTTGLDPNLYAVVNKLVYAVAYDLNAWITENK